MDKKLKEEMLRALKIQQAKNNRIFGSNLMEGGADADGIVYLFDSSDCLMDIKEVEIIMAACQEYLKTANQDYIDKYNAALLKVRRVSEREKLKKLRRKGDK